MDVAELKQYIYAQELTPTILENLGCHHIVKRNGYWQCGNPDGDNKTAITVYDCDYLTTVDYTRDIASTDNGNADIFDLVCFFTNQNFFQVLKTVCKWCDIDYYYDTQQDMPLSLQIIDELYEQLYDVGDDIEKLNSKPLKPISERILKCYQPYVNDFFKNDGISYETQQEFEIGYDDATNRITIPVRDEFKTLVGVQGRLFKRELSEDDTKYLFIEPCNKSRVLYGLYKTFPYINRKGRMFITESPKGVMQLWDLGRQNSVATFGKTVSQSQADKISRLCVDVCFLFDKDVTREEIEKISQKFMQGIKVYAVIDRKGILDEKESPTDNPEKFKELIKTSVERII